MLPEPPSSYKILNPTAVDKESDPKKIAEVILDSTGLDSETFRLGHTKACLIRIVDFCFLCVLELLPHIFVRGLGDKQKPETASCVAVA